MDIKQDGYFHETKFIDRNGHLRTTRVPVVQELALKGLKDLPKRFISLKPDSPLLVPTSCVQDGSDSSETLLPPIDVAKLRYHGLGSEGRTQELARLASVVKEMGMFLIVNHGIECCVLEDVKDVVKGFFGLSFEEKRESVGTYMDVDNMGYGRNFVKSEDQPLDWIDRLTMKAAPKDATDGLLVWPQKPPNFRKCRSFSTSNPWFCKINCDVAAKKGSNQASIAAILRDSKGELLDSVKKIFVSSSLQGEALACRWACLSALSSRLPNVEIEGDNQLVIHLSVSDTVPP